MTWIEIIFTIIATLLSIVTSFVFLVIALVIFGSFKIPCHQEK